MKFLTIRHGATRHPTADEIAQNGYQEPEITDLGKQQSNEIVFSLMPYKINHVISSVRIGCQQTAAPTAKYFQLPIWPTCYLRSIEILNEAEIIHALNLHYRGEQNWKEAWFEKKAGLEPPKDVWQRSIDGALSLARTFPKETLPLFCHEENIWALIAWRDNIPYEEIVLSGISIPHATIYEFEL